MLLRFRDSILNAMKRQLDGAEKAAERARKRIIKLEAERRNLLQAYMAEAVPIDLLKEEQNRITRELAQAGGELANSEVDWETVSQRVSAAMKLVSQLHDVYLGASDATRKRINQAVWEGFDVDDQGVVGARLTDPMAALVAEDLLRALGAEKGNQEHLDGVPGSRLTSLVEYGGVEPPASAMRMPRSSQLS